MAGQRLQCIVITIVTAAMGAALAASPAWAIADKDCGDFASQKAAQIFFLNHGGPNSDPHGLDADSDGVACESNPAPYYYGTSLPGGGGDKPEPKTVKVRTSVKLVLSTTRAITGEAVRLVASVRPQGVRAVVFQRQVRNRWKPVGRDTSDRRGKAVFNLRTPSTKTTYRALVREKKVGKKRFTSATSRSRTLRIHTQKLTLTFDDRSVTEGAQLRATVRALPARATRRISLQVRRQGAWQDIRSGKQNRRGRVAFGLAAGMAGQHEYRAVAERFHGAAATTTSVKTITVRDVTPPTAPTGLTASSGDGTVQLGWSAVAAEDLSHYTVFLREDGVSTWTTAGETTATGWPVAGLTNGITYWFRVVSVDTSDNPSTPTPEVSATPTATPAP